MCLSDAGEALSWEKEKNAPPSVAQAFLPLIRVVGAALAVFVSLLARPPKKLQEVFSSLRG